MKLKDSGASLQQLERLTEIGKDSSYVEHGALSCPRSTVFVFLS